MYAPRELKWYIIMCMNEQVHWPGGKKLSQLISQALFTVTFESHRTDYVCGPPLSRAAQINMYYDNCHCPIKIFSRAKPIESDCLLFEVSSYFLLCRAHILCMGYTLKDCLSERSISQDICLHSSQSYQKVYSPNQTQTHSGYLLVFLKTARKPSNGQSLSLHTCSKHSQGLLLVAKDKMAGHNITSQLGTWTHIYFEWLEHSIAFYHSTIFIKLCGL